MIIMINMIGSFAAEGKDGTQIRYDYYDCYDWQLRCCREWDAGGENFERLYVLSVFFYSISISSISFINLSVSAQIGIGFRRMYCKCIWQSWDGHDYLMPASLAACFFSNDEIEVPVS